MKKFIGRINLYLNTKRSLIELSFKMKSFESVFKMRNHIKDLYLEADRQEKNTDSLKIQLDTLNWVLSEE